MAATVNVEIPKLFEKDAAKLSAGIQLQLDTAIENIMDAERILQNCLLLKNSLP